MSTLDNLGKRLDRVQLQIVPPGAAKHGIIFFQAKRHEQPYPSVEQARLEILEEQPDVRAEYERLRAQGATIVMLPCKDESLLRV